MKKIWNRILAVVLCVLFLLGSIPLAEWEQFSMDFSGLSIRANAADYSGYCGYSALGTGKNLTWEYDPNTGALTISGTGRMKNYQNSASSAPWGQYHEKIRSITIEDGVTEIGRFAFTHCYYFTSIYLPDSVTEVGYAAFNECHGLTTVRFPAECRMQPTGSGSNYASFDGCVNLRKVILGGNVISSETLRGFSDKTTIREVVTEDSVRSIDSYAFENCTNLNSIFIASGVTAIRIPDSFNNCVSLNAFSVDPSNPQYSSDESGVLFTKDHMLLLSYPCAKPDNVYTIPDGVYGIGAKAFSDCKNLTGVTISKAVVSVSPDAFSGCENLRAFQADEENTAFSTDAAGVLFNKAKTSLIRYPIAGTALSYEIPSGVQTVDNRAFSGSRFLTQVVLPEGVAEIGSYSFDNCKSLTEITIPGSVSRIRSCCFYGSTNIRQVYYTGSLTQWCRIAFADSYANPVFYAHGLHIGGALLKNAVIPSDVTKIGNYAFSGCSSLESIAIPDSITEIGNAAFQNCTGIERLVLPGSIQNEMIGAFSGCSGLKSVELEQGVASVGARMFQNCTSLTRISVPEGVTKIADNAFGGCSALQEAELPDTAENIHETAFQSCDKLTVYCSENSYARTYCENNGIPYQIYDYALVYAPTATARPRETVSVPVYIAHNTGFSGLALFAHYDKSVFTPVSVTPGELLSGGTCSDSIGALDNGVVKILYTAADGQDVTQNGLLFTIRFAVNESADGTQSVRFTYSKVDTFDADFEDVQLRCRDAEVRIDPNSVPLFFAQNVQVNPGSRFTVPLTVRGTSALHDFSLQLIYDSTILQLEEVVPAKEELRWEDDTLTGRSADLSDGVLAYATFSALADDSGSTNVELRCTDASAVCIPFSVRILTCLTVEMSDLTAFSGQTITVPVKIRNNPGVMGMGLDVQFDQDALTPAAVTKGAALAGGLFDYDWDTDGCLKIVWSADKQTLSTGTAFNLVFLVSDDLPADKTMISVACRQEDTFDEQWESVPLSAASAQVHLDSLEVTGRSKLFVGEQTQLIASYRFDSVPHSIFTYTSLDPSVASVEPDGTVTALHKGNVQIMVKDENGGVACFALSVISKNPRLRIFSYDGSFEQKVKWWRKYATATMRLGVVTENCDEAVRFVWSTDSFRMDVDRNGLITNTGCFARSGKITLTAYDAQGNVVTSSSVTVRFYKFDWQYRRLQSQELVSDNIFKSAAEPTQYESETLVSIVSEFLSSVFLNVFRKR